MAIFAAILARPLFGACLFLFGNPLLVGIARGEIGTVLRPNEILLLFILGAISLRILLLMVCARYKAPRFDSMDAALLALVATGSALPLVLQQIRNISPSADDLLYAAVLVKYYALFRLFRGCVRNEADVLVCLKVSFAAAALVAVVAILQVAHFFGIAEFLLAYYDSPFEGHQGVITTRATSTIASTFGFGDLMIINLVAVLALMRLRNRVNWTLGSAAVLFLVGCVVSGTISVYLGLAVALLAFGLLTRSLHRLLPASIAAAAVAALAFWPVIENRLEGFTRLSGMPSSWEGRQANLERLVLPALAWNDKWLFGVQPAPRIPAPEAWREMVYIESGYLWLLWIGGVPFLLAFFGFTAFALYRLAQVARRRTDVVECAATAGFCWVAAMAVLMLFDPHLTIRGGADLFFPLLALALVPAASTRQSAPHTILPERFCQPGLEKDLAWKR
ncbi:hypothetical protein [Rhodovastum atsumiense]|uniref:hypothetical protein n=1 Tax=Rhodovastum atsumiense TaxID=504468 RepID=UPI00139F2AA2|nr:hypothetical protein [Rhodovastum atsumiense]